MLTWPHQGTDWACNLEDIEQLYRELTNKIRQFEPVLIIAVSETHRNYIDTLLHHSTKTDLYPIHYCCCPSNDTWARDYGPLSLFNGDQLILLDFEFNGWGGKYDAALDTQISKHLLQQSTIQSLSTLQNVSVQFRTHHYVFEGGAIDTDGLGTLLATRPCLLAKSRNPNYTDTENETFLKKALGLDRILWLDHGMLDGDDTDGHIDTLARFVSPSDILYQACDDPSDTHFSEFSLMAQQLKEMKQIDGAPYQLTALPWPEACFNAEGIRLPATYANFLIINDAVLVPLYNVPQDEAAIDVFRSVFTTSKKQMTETGTRKREVIGINCRPLIEQLGSLHCITMNIMRPLSNSNRAKN